MKQTETRREFLTKISMLSLAVPFLSSCTFAQTKQINDLELIKRNANQTSCNWCGAKDAPADISHKAILAKKDETGDPIIVSGTVYLRDGKTPAPNILIYVYHTDTDGLYGKAGEPAHGRFRGWMLTDENGRYEIETIKPAPYPNRRSPAHIHYTLTGKTFKEDWIDTVWFEGDQYITAETRKELKGKGGFNSIIKLEKKSDGILSGVRDIRLEKDWM
jgi:protocatechuate 3,4-dioxygenase beta subunit